MWLGCMACSAAHNKQYNDTTLRLDYILSGNAAEQHISLSAIHATPGWYGRKVNLSSAPLRGNGRVLLTDAATGDTIYINGFSTLFQEWLVEPEAQTISRAFETSIAVPEPIDTAIVDIVLYNPRGEVAATMAHTLNPRDILIRRHKLRIDTTLVRNIHRATCQSSPINVAIIAEGYSQGNMERFYTHAHQAVDAILSHEPFDRHADKFNFIAVGLPSRDNGVSIPRLGQWRDTPADSHFSTFYSPRYLTTNNLHKLHNTIGGLCYDHIIILANTEEYGGGGIYNSYTLTTTYNPMFSQVVVHEFGHSFAGLADEYFGKNDNNCDSYPTDIEPWEQNITTLVDFSAKWSDLVETDQPSGSGTPGTRGLKSYPTQPVGIYEGAAYSTHGIYRPADFCRMRVNEASGFCPVCIRAIEAVILHLTSQP